MFCDRTASEPNFAGIIPMGATPNDLSKPSR
jgi:hypothetical protein